MILANLVKVELRDQVVADIPSKLFSARAGNAWANFPDDRGFILGVPDDAGEDFPITLIVNWENGRPKN